MVVIPSLLQCVAEHLQQLACHVGSRRYRKAFTQISTTDTRLRERKRALAERPTRARFAGALKGRLLECTHVRRIANAAPRGRMPGKRARARTNFGHARFAGTIATAIAQILCTWKGNTMKQPSDVFNDLQARIGDLLKNSPAKDVERNVKAMLTQGFEARSRHPRGVRHAGAGARTHPRAARGTRKARRRTRTEAGRRPIVTAAAARIR